MTIAIIFTAVIAAIIIAALVIVGKAERRADAWRRAILRIANEHERQDNGWDWEHGRINDKPKEKE